MKSFLQKNNKMKSTLFQSEDIYKISEVLNFPSNNVHIVCPAIKKGAICSHLLYNNCNMDIAEIGKLCDLVNYNKRTGCLYPRYKLTLIPTYDAIKNNDINITLNEIIDDIIESNEKYLKATHIVIIIDDSTWPNALVLKDHIDKAFNDRKDLIFVNEASFYSI